MMDLSLRPEIRMVPSTPHAGAANVGGLSVTAIGGEFEVCVSALLLG